MSAREMLKFNELSSFMNELFECVKNNKDLNYLMTINDEKEYTYRYILDDVKKDYNKIMDILSKYSEVEEIVGRNKE
jgi:hypothetical protein